MTIFLSGIVLGIVLSIGFCVALRIFSGAHEADTWLEHHEPTDDPGQ